MLFKPKDELDKYHGDCSYERSGIVTGYKGFSVPVEVMDLCVVHVGHSIFCRRHKRGARNFGHVLVRGEYLFTQSIFKQEYLAMGLGKVS